MKRRGNPSFSIDLAAQLRALFAQLGRNSSIPHFAYFVKHFLRKK